MIPWAYYNEHDAETAAWLQNNIDAGLIAPGCVDTRSIVEVQPDDLDGFIQCHFFAGVGGWSYAARLAHWPDELPLWSGSCPCQPFSAAGKGLGTDDPRHLWPHLFQLARARRPAVLVGEQVAGSAGYDWFDGVRADLEGEAYACRSVDIPALAVDAPHQRNRLYWVALADTEGSGGSPLVDASCDRRREGRAEHGIWRGRDATASADRAGNLADPDQPIVQGQPSTGQLRFDEQDARTHHGRNGSWWAGADWIACHDGKARRVADASAPLLAHGFPNRILAWRGLGNAIVPPLAAEVLGALMDLPNSQSSDEG